MTEKTRLLVARRVRKWYEAKKITQSQLAAQAGLGLTVVEKIVNGRDGGVKVSTLEKIAQALDIELWQLFDPIDASTSPSASPKPNKTKAECNKRPSR